MGDAQCLLYFVLGSFVTPASIKTYDSNYDVTQEYLAWHVNNLKNLKEDMVNARKLPNLADAIDAADTEIASITEKKTKADKKKTDLIQQYYDSGKKEEQA